MKEINEQLQELAERLTGATGTNLESLVLYGSAAREDFNDAYSDVNVMCVLRDASGAILDQVTSVVRWWVNELGQRPPLFVTAQELNASADVFAIETLDIKNNHRLLAGRDVLSTIEVPMNLHRVQLEHELRTLLLRLRQHYLLSGGKEDELEKVLAKSASSVMVLLRHTLIALGAPVPNSKLVVLSSAGQELGLDVSPVHQVLNLREGRRIETGVSELYQRYMQFVSVAAARVDQALPKKEWQRVAAQSAAKPGERIG